MFETLIVMTEYRRNLTVNLEKIRNFFTNVVVYSKFLLIINHIVKRFKLICVFFPLRGNRPN